MKIQLKDNIVIEGFDVGQKSLLYDRILQLRGRQNVIYDGKTSEIPEEIAKECALNWRTDGLYNNYKISSQYEEYMFKTARESIQSACNQIYCIIYKEK